RRLIRQLSGPNGSVHSIDVLPNTNIVVTGSDDSRVRLWNLVTGQRLQVLNGHSGPITSVSFVGLPGPAFKPIQTTCIGRADEPDPAVGMTIYAMSGSATLTVQNVATRLQPGWTVVIPACYTPDGPVAFGT